MGLELVVSGFLFPSFVVGDGQFVGLRVGRVGDGAEQHDQFAGAVAGPVGHGVLDDPDDACQWPAFLVLGVGVVGQVITVLRREKILTAAKDGDDLTDHPDAQDEKGWPLARIVRVVEYTVPDRAGNGTGELIVLLSTVTDPADAKADELAVAYHERWEQETGNDQLKTHLRGPGKVLRSRLPDLVHQEIYCAMKRSVISPAQRGEIGGTSLDPMANSPPKGDSGEDNSMPGN